MSTVRTLIAIKETETSMVHAYRDDLEAAQQRADGLERELAEVRARNLELEQRIAVSEAPENTRRLEAAIEHERRERERLQTAVEHERRERQRLEAAARAPREELALVRPSHLSPAVARGNNGQGLAAAVLAVVFGCAILPSTVATGGFVIGVMGLVAYALTRSNQ
jgi:hypothetical protein